jgi:hypothetical protein
MGIDDEVKEIFRQPKILSDADLRDAAKKRAGYAQTQEEKFAGRIPGTVIDFHEKRANRLTS